MEDLDAGHCRGGLQPGDDAAGLVGAGIAFAAMTTVTAGSGRQRGETVSRVPSTAASSRASRSDSSRTMSAWHSGSPKRTLYSISFGPSAVSIRPA
jgi:hypothetical protein